MRLAIVLVLVLGACDSGSSALERRRDEQRHEAIRAREAMQEEMRMKATLLMKQRELEQAQAEHAKRAQEAEAIDVEMERAMLEAQEASTAAGKAAAKKKLEEIRAKREALRKGAPGKAVPEDCINNPLGC